MSVLEMTTLLQVKTVLGGETTYSDSIISSLITAVSDGAAIYLNRDTLAGVARTQVYPVKPTQPYVWLRAFPIASVASIKFSACRDFSTATAFDAAWYDVITDSGEIYLRNDALRCMGGPGFLQIVYTGGMAVDAGAFMAAYPRIANAVTSDVINRLNRSKNPEGNVQFGMVGGVAYQKQLQPLDDLKVALSSQRRVAA